MQKAIKELLRLGIFPNSENISDDHLQAIENNINAIKKPISDNEALMLMGLFGDDDLFGFSWTLLHIIETSPNWPIKELFEFTDDNEWIVRLKRRLVNLSNSSVLMDK